MAINPIHFIREEPSRPIQEPVFCPEEPKTNAEEPLPLDPPYVPDLARISRNLRQASHARQKAIDLEQQLNQSCAANARATRLCQNAYSVRRILAECLKAEDKQSFLTLYNAYHDLSEQCHNAATSYGRSRPSHSFLDQLPVVSREAVLTLLHKIRYDGDFIAERLALLSQKELQSLYQERNSLRSGESVLNSANWSPSRGPRHLGYAVDVQTENLSSCEYASPLRTLMNATRSVSGEVNDLSLDVWSTVCARLVQDKRQGSEKIVPAILDVWSSQSAWPGKQRLEEWILRTVQDGAFLADQPNKLSFRVRVQGWPESSLEDNTRAESFYSSAVSSLLDILGDEAGLSVIPESILDLCRAVWTKLESSPGHQRMFPQFVATRWLFSPFLYDSIVTPEAYGMLDRHYISDNIRQYVLREIASRTQKAVLDVIYSWRHGNVSAPHTPQRIQRVLDRFHIGKPIARQSDVDARPLCAVSAKELVSLINTLYPKQRPASVLSRSDAVQSSASSVSGFSLFSNAGLDFPRTSPLPAMHDSSSTATLNSHSTTPVNADHPHALDLDKLAIWSEYEQLREASTLLEDVLATHDLDHASIFATLTGKQNAMRLYSVSETLQTTSVTTLERRETRKVIRSIEDVLLTSSELDTGEKEDHTATLIRCFESFISSAEKVNALLEAHSWSAKLDDMLNLPADTSLASLLQRIEDNAITSLQAAGKASGACGALLEDMQPAMDRLMTSLTSKVTACQDLRISIWYATDVRTSAAYDEIRSVTNALKTMAKTRKPTKPKTSPPALRHWGTTKLSSNNLQFKTEAQILELISASREQGGPNKLGDEQSRHVGLWMDRNGIENLCRGEERIHKFCMDVRRCSEQMTADNAPVWSSPLFADGWSAFGKPEDAPIPSRVERPSYSITPKSSAGISSRNGYTLSNASSRDELGPRSPALTNRSSVPFWSPAVTEAGGPSSTTSIGSTHTQAHFSHYPYPSASAHHNVGKALQRKLISLLISDVGMQLFSDGAETDTNLFSGFGGELATLYLNLQRIRQPAEGVKSRFDYQAAFKKLLVRFCCLVDPFAKLTLLDDINQLITAFCQRGGINGQAGSLMNVNVDQFVSLFSDGNIRPTAIFRDLQYIASLVPEALASNTSKGQAFSNAALALLRLKGELTSHFVLIADGIIQYHTNNRGHGRTSSSAQEQRDSATFLPNSRTPPAEDVARYSMADAAFLLQVTAKEGISAAQRELGTLYLTHPELMDHMIAPLARPREVFKEELESKWRKNQDPTRCDPATMCVAHHWMSLASQGGDALAQEYLRQREEMERLP